MLDHETPRVGQTARAENLTFVVTRADISGSTVADPV
jgi:hypothetical protein